MAAEMHVFLLGLLSIVKIPEIIDVFSANYSAEIVAEYDAILKWANLEEPQPDYINGKRRKQSPGRNLLDRLKLHRDGVLAFASQAGVPFTNNQAERDLRSAKVKQKVSGCFRTVSGAEVYARIQGAILTFRKRDEKVLTRLRALFA